MKVLHIDTGSEWRGGQQQAMYLHAEMCRRGLGSLLACTRGGELEAKAREAGLPVRGLPLRGEWDLFSAWSLAKIIREQGVTHVHAHSAHAQTLGIFAAKFSGLKHVVATRRVDFPVRDHLANRWKYGPSVSRIVTVSGAIADILAHIANERNELFQRLNRIAKITKL